MNRPLTEQERSLALWMLENGNPEASAFIEQLNNSTVTEWKCPCGCASFNFKVEGRSEAPSGVHVLGDFLCGFSENLHGVFIFESGGTLKGVELYGLAGNAPSVLPSPSELRPFDATSQR